MQDGPALGQQPLAVIRQAQPLANAIEQPDPELRLEVTDLA